MKTTEINGWVSSSCPLAPWRHERRVDRNPSFGIKIDPEGPSYFNCFTCHQHGSLPKLLKEISENTGSDFTHLISSVDKEELLGKDLDEWGAAKPKREVLGAPLDEDLLFLYDSAEDNEYLRDRNIPVSIIRKFGILYDPDNRGVPRVLIPIRHTDGKLYGFLGRATNEGIPKVRDYDGLPKRMLLFGAFDAIKEKPDFIIVCEGVFDALRMWAHGYPAVAVMHSTLTDAQARILKNNFKSVIFMYDNDKAGIGGRKLAASALREYMTCFKVVYPKGVNDPDELSRTQTDAMIDRKRLI